jgi:hypothetical protein
MPRNRTTPETIATAHSDRVVLFGMRIGHSADGTPVAAESYFTYGIESLDASGNVLRKIGEDIAWSDLPAGVKTDLKAVFQKVLTDAENKGYIGAGDDEGDLV